MNSNLTAAAIWLPRPALNSWTARWAVIAAIGAADLAVLSALGITIDTASAARKLPAIAVLLGLGTVYQMAAVRWPRYRRLLLFAADVLLAFSQVFVLIELCVPLSYAAALANFPMIDHLLIRIDTALGCDWVALDLWVRDHWWVGTGLTIAYFSMPGQTLTLLVVSGLRRTGERAAELVWLAMVAMILTCSISIWTPAVAHAGKIGMAHIDLLRMIRDGQWTVFTFEKVEGIVQFPSFHTTLALIFVYLARREPWLLALFVPLNTVMLLSVPPIGGHYLVDMLGGTAVFCLSVPAAIWLQRVFPVRHSFDGR